MGTITKIRQVSPYVFIVFAVLFVVFMMLSDNISQLAGGGGENVQTAVICKINNEKIYYKDFDERVKIRLEQMRRDPKNEGQDIDEQQARNQIWDELVKEKLLLQAGEQFGIKVSDEEILDILLENPPDYLKRSFTDSAGVFYKDNYLKLLTKPEEVINYVGEDPAQMPLEVKQRHIDNWRNEIIAISEHIRMNKLQSAMVATIIASHAISSPSYIEKTYIDNNSNADINHIFVNSSLITDSVTVTEEEMRAYFEKHKNNFKVKNERKVKYLMFPVKASEEDSIRITRKATKIQEEFAAATTPEEKDSVFSVKINEHTGIENDWQLIQELDPQVLPLIANANEKDIIGPISKPDGIHFYRLDGRRTGTNQVIKASHILINFGNNKDSAKAVANEIKKTTTTTNFAKIAMEKSNDPGSAQQGGDLGYFGRHRMIPEFESAAFNAKVGSIVGPVETEYGYHIIYVTDKKSDELKYSQFSLYVTTSNNTKNQIKRDAFAAMKQIEAGENIDSLAAKLNISNPAIMLQESQFMTKDKPFLNSMFLTNKIFESKKGDVIEPREVYDGYQVAVVQVNDIRKEGIGKFEDDSARIRVQLTKIKKLDLAQKRADEVYNLIKNNSTLEGITDLPYNLQVYPTNIRNNGTISGTGTFPDYSATMHAFMLPTGKINSPIRGEFGYYIFEIKNRLIPTIEEAKGALDVNRQQYTRNLFDNWFAKFKETSTIIDYRSKYYSDF